MSRPATREIPGCPGYLVSDNGRVWTVKRKGGNDHGSGRIGEPREMSYSTDSSGYLRVTLLVAGRVRTRLVHHLVLEAFVGPRPAGMEGCHFPDAARANNRIVNLRWDTHTENVRDRWRGQAQTTDKRCKRCGKSLAGTAFYKDSRARDGLHSNCKRCHMAVSVATRDPDKKRAANRTYMRRVRSARVRGD